MQRVRPVAVGLREGERSRRAVVSGIAAVAIFCACAALVASSGGSRRVSFFFVLRVSPRPTLALLVGGEEMESAQHLAHAEEC